MRLKIQYELYVVIEHKTPIIIRGDTEDPARKNPI